MSNAVKNSVMGTVLAALAALAVYRFVTAEGGAAKLPTTYTIDAVCLACREPGEYTQEILKRPPLACKKCSKEAVYAWMFCFDCKCRYVPKLQRAPNGVLGPPMVPTCPKCNSQRGGGYNSLDPEHKPSSDGPLPAWP